MTACKRVFCPAALECRNIRVLDTETTGLDPNSDEIVQIAIIDGKGNVLLDSLVRPCFNDSWKDAERIHGICPEDVRNAPTIAELHDRIADALSGAEIIAGYNHIAFDIPFLRNAGIEIPDCSFCDVMLDDADLRAMKDGYGSEYCWSSLKDCAAGYGIRFHAHDAKSDAEATRRCMFEIATEMMEVSGTPIETFCKEDCDMTDDLYVKSTELLVNASESALKCRILKMVSDILSKLDDEYELDDLNESLGQYISEVEKCALDEIRSTEASIAMIAPDADMGAIRKMIESYGDEWFEEWFQDNVVEPHYNRKVDNAQIDITLGMMKVLGGA